MHKMDTRKCEICKHPIPCKRGIRVHGVVADLDSSTGECRIMDSCVVCISCYKEHFPYLAFRGKIRDRKEKESK
jgi:hypothetical protein